MSTVTRRHFNKTAAATGLATALSASRVLGANERIRVGFIGLGNRGDQVLDAFLAHKDAEIAAICDIYQPYLDFAAKKIGGEPAQFRDYRKLLERKDLDAVAVCTPDHWHALQMIHACEAQKDVYVEKPLSLCVAEGRKMVEAAKRTNRVVQVGIQRLSSAFCREAAEIVRSGGIGKITAVRCFHIQNEFPKGIGSPADGEAPGGFDWDAWLGPAPMRPYNLNRSFYRFRWFYDYSGGQLTNFGVHYLAQIHASLGVTTPLSVVAMGGKFGNYDSREIPDTMEVVWHYPGDTLVSFTQYNASAAPGGARPSEVELRGTKGTMYFNLNGYEIAPDSLTPNEFFPRGPLTRERDRGYMVGAKPQIEPAKKAGRIADADHARNFLDCVKSRKTPSCDIEFGHRTTSAALIGNIAHKTRALLDWDAKAERFTNNDAANKLLSYEYRAPHKLA
ncbi:MAG: Gfo/Idh/MocA family oxidoreductase [Tepidisphaeraceae bacterium]